MAQPNFRQKRLWEAAALLPEVSVKYNRKDSNKLAANKCAMCGLCGMAFIPPQIFSQSNFHRNFYGGSYFENLRKINLHKFFVKSH